ncbi:MAG: tRNA 2-thiouridine(34) synthase MnmA [Acidimicrobiales bacterium]
MRVLVGLSGGVDSSVAAALLVAQGHDVVGVTLKLWGGAQDSGCCSVGDVEDARRAAQQLGVAHHVFNFSDDFEDHVVAPYVEAHARGRTPNPCVECNRHLKFRRLTERADQLGFDAVATGHHARVVGPPGSRRLARGRDRAKDQSYVLHMLGSRQLERILLPVGELTKPEVRARAAALGLRTAAKPESQDTCFITASGGREAFLGSRIPLRAGRLIDRAGVAVGAVPAVELVTVGQRRGLGGSGGERRYASAVDTHAATVTVGPLDELLTRSTVLEQVGWAGPGRLPAGSPVQVQMSAHGRPAPATWDGAATIVFGEPQRRPAPGQSVVLYDAATGDVVLGGGVAA